MRNGAGDREHDADDQTGFENLTKNDDQRGEHNASPLSHDRLAAHGLDERGRSSKARRTTAVSRWPQAAQKEQKELF